MSPWEAAPETRIFKEVGGVSAVLEAAKVKDVFGGGHSQSGGNAHKLQL